MKKFAKKKKLILIGALLLVLLIGIVMALLLGNRASAQAFFTLDERDVLMEVGDSKMLELELGDTKISESELKVSWKSSKASVATVDEDGTVKAVAGGETKVTAVVEYKGKQYSTKCVVTVKADGNEYSTYKIRWYTQKQDRTGYDIKEETFERLVGSKAELTALDAKKNLPANYTFNEEKSILTGTVKEALGACVLEVYFDVAEITYSVDYYYESDTKLGTYTTKETKKYTTWAFSEVNVTDKPKTGFVINEAIKGTVKSNDSVVAGSKLKVYCDRIRSKVTVTYISGKASATYDAIYGIGLLNAPEDVFEDTSAYVLASYVNGKKKDAAEAVKTLTADAEIAIKLDGKGFDCETVNGVSTLTNNSSDNKTPSFAVLNGASNTIYLSATYTKTGSSSNRFGITLSDGKTTRQIRFAGTGITVMKGNTTSGGIASVDNATNTYANAGVYNDGDVYVWAHNAKSYGSTKVSSVISDMMRNASGGSYDICWAVVDNILFASIDGETVLRLPLKYLDASWTGSKKYQIGFSAYDANTWGDALQISNVNLKFGKDAKALLVAEESFDSTLSYRMGYDALTGAYMPSSNAEAAYMYGKESSEATGISAKIEWANIDNACSAVGISLKLGEESVQYVVEGENTSYRSQRNHTWAGINKIGTQILKEGTPVSTEGKAEVTAFVKGDYFYVMYNGVQVQCINMLSLFPEYTRDSKVSLGICTWDARYGLTKFTDVKQLSASEVNSIANADEWGFYSESLTIDDYSFTDDSITKSSSGKKRVKLFGSNETWQIEGRINRLDDTTKDLLMGFEISSGKDKILIVARNNGFMKIVNENWSDSTRNSNCNYGYDSTLCAFNNIVSAELFNDNGNARTQEYIDYKAVLYADTLYVWFKDEAGNEGLCWRIPLTDEEFGAFEAGSDYKMTLYFAETDTDASMTNLDVKMGYQVTEQTDFVADNKGKTYTVSEAAKAIKANITRWDTKFRQKTISGMLAEELGTGVEGYNAAYAYLKGSSSDVYLSATYNLKANATPGHFGISITDGTETRSILYKNFGVFIQKQDGTIDGIPAIPSGQTKHYYNTAVRTGYVWTNRSTTNTVSEMLSSKTTEHEHEVKWAITDGVLYGMVDDFVFFRMPVEKLCADWNEDTKFQIGFDQWYIASDGDVETIKDIDISFGEDALAKMVKDKAVENSESAGMTYEVFNGTYLPNSTLMGKYLYGNKTSETQVMKATMSFFDKASAGSSVGITVKSGDKSAQFITVADGNAHIKFNHSGTGLNITSWLHAEPYDSNGVCNVTAVVKDSTLYIFYNGNLAGSVDLYKVIDGYKTGDEVQLGIYSWYPNYGLNMFSDISFKAGENAEDYISSNNITLNDTCEWEIFTNDSNGTAIGTTLNADGTVSGTNMTGNGKTHICTPTADQSNCGAIYGVATSMPQMLTAELTLEDLASSTCGNGVSVECNGQSVEFYTLGTKKYIRIQVNHSWGMPVYYDYPTDDSVIYDENGVCNITAIIKDGMLYIQYGDAVAYKAELSVLFPGYTTKTKVRLGVCTWDSINGVSEFSNVKLQAGASVDVDTTINYKAVKFVTKSGSNFSIDNGNVVRKNTSQAASMLFNGESDIWEVTGTIERTDKNYNSSSYILLAGFRIQQGDNIVNVMTRKTGISMQNAAIGAWKNIESLDGKYLWHSLGSNTMFDFNWIESKGSEIDFKAVIYEDVLYVWLGEALTPAWRIDLTQPIPNNNFTFAVEEPYSFGFNLNNNASGATYKNITVKTTDTDGSIKDAVEAFEEAIE